MLGFSTTRRLLSTQAVKPKTGVLFMNLGGPENLEGVRMFLQRLFSDGDLIPLPFQSNLAKFLARRRTPQIQEQYAQIGGGSPIKKWTELQARLLTERLDQSSPQTGPHKAYIAFRYAPPLTDDALQSIKEDGVKHVVVFTQYPQYSCSTTGSSLNELYRRQKVVDPEGSVKFSLVDRWFAHAGLVEAFAERIEQTLKKMTPEQQKDAVLLFSAHSLPLEVVNRGDAYSQEVAATVNAIMTRLKFSHPYRLVWQSKVGPRPWLGPSTESVLKGYAKMGKQNVVLIPVAFTSDHIETLFELDIEYGHVAYEAGMKNLVRVESLNDSPTFIKALEDIMLQSLKNPSPSTQFPLRCAQCTNPTCGEMRDFFGSQ